MEARIGSAPGSRRRRREDGFSLVEMLAVVTIIALAAGMLSFNTGSASRGLDLKAAAVEIAARLRNTRAAAINGHRQEVMLIDVARGRLVAGDGRASVALPAGLTIAVTAADAEARSSSIAGIRFFPNGSSTGATIKVTGKNDAYEVRVNWLTGRVSVSRLP